MRWARAMVSCGFIGLDFMQAKPVALALCLMILHLLPIFQGALGVLGRQTCLSNSLF
jgi:hypothetical protein